MNRDLIIFENRAVNFVDFVELSAKITGALKRNVPDKCGCVAFLMNKSPEQICLFYTLLHEGYRCVPIDPIMPKDRVVRMIQDCSADLVISDEINYGIVSSFKETVCFSHLMRTVENVVTGMDGDEDFKISDDCSIIYYTSGSTGTPKGVIDFGKGLNNLIDALGEVVMPDGSERILCLSPTTFDMFFIESIMALCRGLSMVLATEEQARNPRSIARLIRDHDVDTIIMTPSRLTAVLLNDPEMKTLTEVKTIMLGGEILPEKLLEELQEHSHAELFNLYGPAEASVCTTYANLTKAQGVHIGKPINGSEVYLLNENGEVSNEGEVCIAGIGLGGGYLNNKTLTAEKFSYDSGVGRFVYKTGDLARREPDGNLHFIGRNDDQVKIRGFRIEIGEIERLIERIPGVTACVVKKESTSDRSELLTAFYTGDANAESIKAALKKQVPYYMIPSVFVHKERLAMTAHGKIDRLSLNCEVGANGRSSDLEEPSGIPGIVIDRFKRQMSLREIDTSQLTGEAIIADLGLSSLELIQIVVDIEERCEMEFEDEKLSFAAFTTIKDVIDYVEKTVSGQ